MNLSNLLEDLAGEGTFELIVPYPFLPPRFQAQAHERNMRLLITENSEIEIHWEGSQLSDCLSLSSAGACKLLREVSRKMSKYRADLSRLDKFLQTYELLEAVHPGMAEPSREPEESFAEKREEIRAVILPANEFLAAGEMGGEPPLPPRDFEHEQ